MENLDVKDVQAINIAEGDTIVCVGANNEIKRVSAEGLGAHGNSGIPFGIIVMWSGKIPPAGWYLYDGNPILRADGTTVRTPNLKGMFIVGYDEADTALLYPNILI